MQLGFSFVADGALLQTIDRRFRNSLGALPARQRLAPTSQMVLSMLGNRTYDAVSRAAFEGLVIKFRSLNRLRRASPDEIYPVIQDVTFAEVKAGRLPAALEMIAQSLGTLSLDSLTTLSVSDALHWLEQLPGVGRKVAAATLNFSTLQMKAMVIDSHHLRVVRRLGIVTENSTAAQAFEQIMPQLPEHWTAEDVDNHHCMVKLLGQQICHYENPECTRCPLKDICSSASSAR